MGGDIMLCNSELKTEILDIGILDIKTDTDHFQIRFNYNKGIFEYYLVNPIHHLIELIYSGISYSYFFSEDNILTEKALANALNTDMRKIRIMNFDAMALYPIRYKFIAEIYSHVILINEEIEMEIPLISKSTSEHLMVDEHITNGHVNTYFRYSEIKGDFIPLTKENVELFKGVMYNIYGKAITSRNDLFVKHALYHLFLDSDLGDKKQSVIIFVRKGESYDFIYSFDIRDDIKITGDYNSNFRILELLKSQKLIYFVSGEKDIDELAEIENVDMVINMCNSEIISNEYLNKVHALFEPITLNLKQVPRKFNVFEAAKNSDVIEENKAVSNIYIKTDYDENEQRISVSIIKLKGDVING